MAGNYYLTVTVNGCTSATDSTLVIVNTTVGSSVLMNNNNISIFPNPANDMIYLNSSGTQAVKIVVYNNLGVCVLQGDLFQGTNSINLDAFSNGIYTICFIDTDRTYYQKLIKN